MVETRVRVVCDCRATACGVCGPKNERLSLVALDIRVQPISTNTHHVQYASSSSSDFRLDRSGRVPDGGVGLAVVLVQVVMALVVVVVVVVVLVVVVVVVVVVFRATPASLRVARLALACHVRQHTLVLVIVMPEERRRAREARAFRVRHRQVSGVDEDLRVCGLTWSCVFARMGGREGGGARVEQPITSQSRSRWSMSSFISCSSCARLFSNGLLG